MAKAILFFLTILIDLNSFGQKMAKNYFISTHIGTIQYYGDLNETESSINVKNYFKAKDPLFGFCFGKNLNNYLSTQVIIEGGSFKEQKSSINLAATTSFFQLSQRFEVDVFNLTHRDIPLDKQKFHTNLYLGVGINNFKSFANQLSDNQSLRQAKETKPVLTYGLAFKFKLKPNTTLKIDFGHNKIFSDIFDASIGSDFNEIGRIKDKKLSSYQTALDLWAGLRVGVVVDLIKKTKPSLNQEL